jgi:hypothetical protein
MNESSVTIAHEHLPFYITGPGESDILFTAVAIALVAIIIGFGALYFTIQAIPDRMVEGAGKAQMQVVGLLGLISLFTMNNLYWIAAILLAAIRIPDLLTPLTEIARALRAGALTGGVPPGGHPAIEAAGAERVSPEPERGTPGPTNHA